jgi:hypothetical protein
MAALQGRRGDSVNCGRNSCCPRFVANGMILAILRRRLAKIVSAANLFADFAYA